MHLIETRDLTYSYSSGSAKALDGINFIAPRNARIAVLGSNGAGKSTLFKHFNGIFRPTSGSVLIRGESISRTNIREVRKFVGIVFQNADDQIFSPTVEQDVAFGPTNLGLDEETIHHRVREALRIMGIEDLCDRVPHHLSGGEKKRVAIAGAIAMEPEILLYDEPTTGIDPMMADAINELIIRMREKLNVTSIAITHDMTSAYKIADRIAMLYQGKIIEVGTPEEIKSSRSPIVQQFIQGRSEGPIKIL